MATDGNRFAPFGMLPKKVAADNDLSMTAKVLFAMLATHEGLPKGIVPGYGRLAKMIGVKSEKTIERAAKELTSHGYAAIRRRGQGATNQYLLYPNGDAPDNPVWPRSDKSVGSGSDSDSRSSPDKKVGVSRSSDLERVEPIKQDASTSFAAFWSSFPARED